MKNKMNNSQPNAKAKTNKKNDNTTKACNTKTDNGMTNSDY